MSQFFVGTAVGSLPPVVPTSFVTDSGTAVPAANVLNDFGGTTTANVSNGIQSTGSGNTVTYKLTNRAVGSATTTAAASSNIITLPLGAIPGVYTFDISVAGFAKTGIGSPAGCGYTIVGSARTDGVTATLIPDQAIDHFEEAILTAPETDSMLTVSGNNLIVQVLGKSDGAAGFVIDWQATLNYTFVS